MGLGFKLPSKWENLQTTTCIGLQSEQIFSVNI